AAVLLHRPQQKIHRLPRDGLVAAAVEDVDDDRDRHRGQPGPEKGPGDEPDGEMGERQVHLILAARVARKPLRAPSSDSPLFMRAKSMCMPRQSLRSSSVKRDSSAMYPSRRARGSVSSSPASSRPLNK